MSRIVDNAIALRILRMLVTPFTDTDAFKLGIIDAEGKNIKRTSTLSSSQERDAYTYLHKLVFNVKKLINRLPGGENRIKNLVAALWLVKEHYQTNNRSISVMQEKFDDILKMLDNRVSLVEEEILVVKFLSEEAPANATGAAVSTNEPKIDPKAAKKYKEGNFTLAAMVKRPKPVEVK